MISLKVVHLLFFLLPLLLNSPSTKAQTISTAPVDASADANKKIMLRFLEEGWNQGNLDVCDQLIAPQAIGHYRGKDFPSPPERAKEIIHRWRMAFEGFHFRIDYLIAEGDRVAAHVPFEGTHAAAFFGIPATGRKINADEILVCRFGGGKIVEFWEVYDEYGLRTELGSSADTTKPK